MVVSGPDSMKKRLFIYFFKDNPLKLLGVKNSSVSKGVLLSKNKPMRLLLKIQGTQQNSRSYKPERKKT